jgi:hypothetical protein
MYEGLHVLGLATAAMFQPAPEKVVMFFISAVVLSVPPAEAVCPLVTMSQKELCTMPPAPTKPPAVTELVALPVE